MTNGRFALYLLLYVLATRACLAWCSGRWRTSLFGLINLTASWVLLFPRENVLDSGQLSGIALLFRYGVYAGLVVVQFLMLRWYAARQDGLAWLAFFTPIAFLVLIKGSTPILAPLFRLAGMHPVSVNQAHFLGLSYLTFRASKLALDVRNGVVQRPDLGAYLGFCFFTPTLSVGPINSYSWFQKGFAGPDREVVPLGRSALRLLVGCVKYTFLAQACALLSYKELLLDGHPHRPVELVIAVVFYYLFLYCNFSGFCDIAIGLAGVLGFPIEENFKNPFAARNLQDFWNRWHITLSAYMRDVVFVPLSKVLVRSWGAAFAPTAIAVAVFVVFVLIGLWHGIGWHFVMYGALHGLAVTVVHFYGIWLKHRLGKDGYKRYLQNAWIRAAGITVTFAYVAASLFFFANDFDAMWQIFSAIRW